MQQNSLFLTVNNCSSQFHIFLQIRVGFKMTNAVLNYLRIAPGYKEERNGVKIWQDEMHGKVV